MKTSMRGSQSSNKTYLTTGNKANLTKFAQHCGIYIGVNDNIEKIKTKIEERRSYYRDFSDITHIIAIDIGTVNFACSIMSIDEDASGEYDVWMLHCENSNIDGLQNCSNVEQEAKSLQLFLDNLFGKRYRFLMAPTTLIIIENQQIRRVGGYNQTINKMVKVESMTHMFFLENSCKCIGFDSSTLERHLKVLSPELNKKTENCCLKLGAQNERLFSWNQIGS